MSRKFVWGLGVEGAIGALYTRIFKSHMLRRAICVCASLTGLILNFEPVAAQNAGSASVGRAASIAFSIPPQSLSTALVAFSHAAGVGVVFDGAIDRSRLSPGVFGSMTPAQALQHLLGSTGLSYHFTTATSVTIERAQGEAGAAVTAPGALTLDTINVQGSGENAWGPGQGYVARQSATATKTDTPLIETPQAISIVSRDQIRQQGAQDLKQALAYTSGVAATTRSAFSGFDIIYSRGFILDRYVDGMKLLGGDVGYTVPQIEPYGVERLEVFHGPTSVLYGQASPGGLVNAVTKRPLDTPFHEVEIQTGNFDRVQGAFDLSGPVNADKTVLYRLTGVARNVESQVDFTKEQRIYIAPALTWRPDANTDLTLLASVQHDPNVGLYSLVPSAGTLTPAAYGLLPRSRFLGDPNYDEYKRDQESISYIFEHSFDESFLVRQNFRYMHTDGEARQLLPLGSSLTNAQVLNRYALFDRNIINAVTLDTQGQAKFATGPFAHTALFGVDYQRLSLGDRLGQALAPSINIFIPVYGYVIPNPATVSNTSQLTNQIGLYEQDQVKLDRFVLTVSGREDSVETDTLNRTNGETTPQNAHAFTWRAGLNYVFDNGVAPYVSYATSFQPASGVDSAGNAFKPTTGQQYEGGIKFQPAGVNALLTVAAFDLTEQNVLTVDPNNSAFNVQTGEIRSRGIEAEGKASLTEGFDLLGSFTYADVKVTKSNGSDLGKRPVNVPSTVGALWAFYTVQTGPFQGLGFGGGVRYVGNTPGDTANSFFVPSNMLFDAAVQYDLGKQVKQLDGVRLAVNTRNMFDRRYVSECSNALNCIYGPGRTILATVRYNW